MHERVFAVIGLGSFGLQVCEELTDRGAQVIAVDNRSDIIDRVKDRVMLAVLLDATDEEAFIKAPLEDVDVGIVAIGENMESSIIATTILKNQGIPYILARAVSDIHHQILEQLGADEVINIEIDEGTRIARRLISPSVLDRISVGRGFSIQELYAPPAFTGKTLSALNLPSRYGVNIIAVKRKQYTADGEDNPITEESMHIPSKNESLQEGDVLLLAGRDSDLEAMTGL